MNLTKSMLTHVIVAHVSVCNKYSTTCNAEKRFIRYEAFQNAFSFYSVPRWEAMLWSMTSKAAERSRRQSAAEF